MKEKGLHLVPLSYSQFTCLLSYYEGMMPLVHYSQL